MPDPKITPECIVCHRPMRLLDEDEERWYCYTDDQIFLAKQNTWDPPLERVAETKRLAEEKRATNPAKFIIMIVLSLVAIWTLFGALQSYLMTQQYDRIFCGANPQLMYRAVCDQIHADNVAAQLRAALLIPLILGLIAVVNRYVR